MFSYAAPTGIVFMQSPDMFTIHPFQGGAPAYISTSYATTLPPTILAAGPPPPQSAAATLVDHQLLMPPPPTQQMQNSNDGRMFSTPRHHHHHHHNYTTTTTAASSSPFVNNNRIYNSHHTSPAAIMRRTRSGHVSKSKLVVKRNATDLTKICPSCSKQWRLCNCSNVKNRPAPKPYCKFVPPRMQQSKQ